MRSRRCLEVIDISHKSQINKDFGWMILRGDFGGGLGERILEGGFLREDFEGRIVEGGFWREGFEGRILKGEVWRGFWREDF